LQPCISQRWLPTGAPLKQGYALHINSTAYLDPCITGSARGPGHALVPCWWDTAASRRLRCAGRHPAEQCGPGARHRARAGHHHRRCAGHDHHECVCCGARHPRRQPCIVGKCKHPYLAPRHAPCSCTRMAAWPALVCSVFLALPCMLAHRRSADMCLSA